jgi:hypothetical protein
MTSARFPPALAELRLRPSPALAAGCAVLGFTAILSVQLSVLPLTLRWIVSLLALIAAAAAVRRFLSPDLRIRLIEDTMEYKPRSGSDWQRMDSGQACFVSPWYVGWRASGLRAYGIFRRQVSADEFRRLAVHLRQRRT